MIAGRQKNADFLKGMRPQAHDTEDKQEVINCFQTLGDNVLSVLQDSSPCFKPGELKLNFCLELIYKVVNYFRCKY